MLYLIGMGLEEGDMTIKGKEAIESCDEVFTDVYTSFPYRIFGRPAEREFVEGDTLVELASRKKVALVVPGDPLFATTHISLIMEARKRGIPFKIIHAPSIINAVSRTGLSPYKFGRIVTVSSPLMKSDEEKIKKNLAAGLHTLCLFDPVKEPSECLHKLSRFNKKVVFCSRLGTAHEAILYGKPDELGNLDRPACAIIPGKLHFFEEDFLELFSIRKP